MKTSTRERVVMSLFLSALLVVCASINLVMSVVRDSDVFWSVVSLVVTLCLAVVLVYVAGRSGDESTGISQYSGSLLGDVLFSTLFRSPRKKPVQLTSSGDKKK